jgi:hypothetical protein
MRHDLVATNQLHMEHCIFWTLPTVLLTHDLMKLNHTLLCRIGDGKWRIANAWGGKILGQIYVQMFGI